MVHGRRYKTIIDCVGSNNEVNVRSCGRDTVQDGYFVMGEISKTTSGTGYNSCSDLYQIINCTSQMILWSK